MAVGKTERAAAETRPLRVCPSCGKTAHIGRKYCDCHADLRRAGVIQSAALPEVGPCNFEAPGLHCGDCPENCMYCASFGQPKTNNAGFGGKACRHRAGTARCYCCRSQTDLAEKLGGVYFSAIIGEIRARNEGSENLFAKAASIMREEIAKPILARINQRRAV